MGLKRKDIEVSRVYYNWDVKKDAYRRVVQLTDSDVYYLAADSYEGAAERKRDGEGEQVCALSTFARWAKAVMAYDVKDGVPVCAASIEKADEIEPRVPSRVGEVFPLPPGEETVNSDGNRVRWFISATGRVYQEEVAYEGWYDTEEPSPWLVACADKWAQENDDPVGDMLQAKAEAADAKAREQRIRHRAPEYAMFLDHADEEDRKIVSEIMRFCVDRKIVGVSRAAATSLAARLTILAGQINTLGVRRRMEESDRKHRVDTECVECNEDGGVFRYDPESEGETQVQFECVKCGKVWHEDV